MRKIFLLLALSLLFSNIIRAQVLCSPNGSIIMYTNYDGGTLNINVDVNMPNLKIGIVSYEKLIVNLSGTYVNNVTAIQYAGYSGNNNNCGGPPLPAVIINGAPAGVTPVITVSPPSPLANVYGNPNIICGYSCDTTVTQGGCNTIDQIQAYFTGLWPGALVRFHKIQYACWAGTQNVSGAGTCCLAAGGPGLLISTNVTQPTCNGACNGSATAVATGGTPPYTFQWTGGPAAAVYPNLCPGTYTVTVTDGAANSATQSVTVINPPPVNTNILQAGAMLSAAATGAAYQWMTCNPYTLIPGAVAQSYTALASGFYAVIVTQNGCTDTSNCINVVVSGMEQTAENAIINVYPNPVKSELNIDIDAKYVGKTCYLYDAVGRIVFAQKLNHTSNKLSVNELSRGIYILQVEGVNKKWKVQK